VLPVRNNKPSSWRFGWGFAIGATLALLALLSTAVEPTEPASSLFAQWLSANLGHSVWLFTLVAVFFAVKLRRLMAILSSAPTTLANHQEVIALDQMLDIWTQVFVGIGVVWTAVGMRAALQSALGDPAATLAQGADDVLRRLVDGGILLALTTTIVGAVGGYMMRLIKTVLVGVELQSYFEALERQEVKALLETATRIEHYLGHQSNNDNVAVLPGGAS